MLRLRAKRFVAASTVAGTLFLAASTWLHRLAYERGAVLDGEYWRLATSHLTHLDAKHALMNAVGVGLVTAVLLEFWRLGTVLVSAAAIAAAISGASVLFRFEPGYAGFSGVLHGFTAMAALALAKRSPWLAAAVASLLVGGVASALAGWSRPWMADVAIHTHVFGIAAGVSIAAWLRYGGSGRPPVRGNSHLPAGSC